MLFSLKAINDKCQLTSAKTHKDPRLGTALLNASKSEYRVKCFDYSSKQSRVGQAPGQVKVIKPVVQLLSIKLMLS